MELLDPDHRSRALLIAICFIQTLSFVVVVLAFTARTCVVRKLAAYDFVMVLAWLIAFAMSFTVCYGLKQNLDGPDQPLSMAQDIRINQALYGFSVLYQLGLMSQKSAILLLYLGVLGSSVNARWATWITLAVVNVGGVALALTSSLRCSPMQAAWLPTVDSQAAGKCIDLVTIYLSSAPLNIITDVAILLIPMPLFWRMTLPKRQKLALIVTFGFGIFVTVVDVIRIAYLELAAESSSASSSAIPGSMFTSPNYSYSPHAYLAALWSVVEVNVGIMCGCVPSLKPWLSHLRSFWNTDEGLPLNSVREIRLSRHLYSWRLGSSNSSAEVITQPPQAETSTSRHDGTAPNASTSLHSVHVVRSANPAERPMESAPSRQIRSTIGQVAMVTFLFLIWGLEYRILFVLNQEFQAVAKFTPWQATGLHSAYYAGYFFGPLMVAYRVLQLSGLKWPCLVGLVIYACGSLIFWPAAVLNSFPAYFISNFVAGFGLSNLEVAADTWMMLLGSPDYAEARLCFGQGVQAVGTVLATVLMDYILRLQNTQQSSLTQLQWIYLGLALCAMIVVVVYYLIPTATPLLHDRPENSAGTFAERREPIRCAWWGFGSSFILGVLCELFYVGGQEVNATSMAVLFGDWLGNRWSPSAAIAVAHGAFAISRFLMAAIGIWTRPLRLLPVLLFGALLFEVLAMSDLVKGNGSTAFLIVVLFMEGPLFPLIFAQTMHHRGPRTSLAAVMVTASIGVGGAAFAPISNALRAQDTAASASRSLAVAVAALGCGLVCSVLLSWQDTPSSRYGSGEYATEQEGQHDLGGLQKNDHGNVELIEHVGKG